MKRLTLGLVVLIGGALALAPGCGDDSDSESNGAGSGGTAGKGGSTSKGGSSTNGGDTSNAGDGNTNAGGEPGGGGTPGTNGGAPTTNGGAPAGGAPGAGGAGFMNPEGCPEAAPNNNDDCSVALAVQSACEYPGSRCICSGYIAGGGGAGGADPGVPGNWICQGDGADCPADAPMTSDACDNNGTHCPYPDGVDCFCAGGDWNCGGPGVDPGAGGAGNNPAGECPATAPDGGDGCNGPIPVCFYDETNTLCSCPGNGPDANEWDCQNL